MHLSFIHNLEAMKYTPYIEKCFEFDAVTYILTFTKRYFSLHHEKFAFWFKKGCLIRPQNQRFRLKKGWGFFSSQIPGKGFFNQTWVRAWYRLWSRVGGGGERMGGRGGGGGGGVEKGGGEKGGDTHMRCFVYFVAFWILFCVFYLHRSLLFPCLWISKMTPNSSGSIQVYYGCLWRCQGNGFWGYISRILQDNWFPIWIDIKRNRSQTPPKPRYYFRSNLSSRLPFLRANR